MFSLFSLPLAVLDVVCSFWGISGLLKLDFALSKENKMLHTALNQIASVRNSELLLIDNSASVSPLEQRVAFVKLQLKCGILCNGDSWEDLLQFIEFDSLIVAANLVVASCSLTDLLKRLNYFTGVESMIIHNFHREAPIFIPSVDYEVFRSRFPNNLLDHIQEITFDIGDSVASFGFQLLAFRAMIHAFYRTNTFYVKIGSRMFSDNFVPFLDYMLGTQSGAQPTIALVSDEGSVSSYSVLYPSETFPVVMPPSHSFSNGELHVQRFYGKPAFSRYSELPPPGTAVTGIAGQPLPPRQTQSVVRDRRGRERTVVTWYNPLRTESGMVSEYNETLARTCIL